MSKSQALFVVFAWLLIFILISALFSWVFVPITTSIVFAVMLGIIFGNHFTNGIVNSLLGWTGAVWPFDSAGAAVYHALLSPKTAVEEDGKEES